MGETPAAAETAETPADVNFDDLAKKREANNAAIMQTIPEANRAVVRAALKRVQEAGYPYARLATNKKHQLDGLHIYAGEKGKGREAAFMACQTKRAAEYAAKRDAAAKAGQPKPKPLAKVFVWSPCGGGNLYARGIFGDIEA